MIAVSGRESHSRMNRVRGLGRSKGNERPGTAEGTAINGNASSRQRGIMGDVERGINAVAFAWPGYHGRDAVLAY
jgi:hypothetical protein